MHATDLPSRPIARRKKVPATSTNMMLRRLNGNKNRPENNEDDSELSDPDSNITLNELEDEIIVSGRRSRGAPKMSSGRLAFEDNADKVMEDAPEESAGSHYSKRKRASIANDLSESKLESDDTTDHERLPTPPASTNKFKPIRQSFVGPGGRGVLLGTWKDSNVPDDEMKHAVIGILTVRDNLRFLILPSTKHGESLAGVYPLPPGSGRSWVSFNRVKFSDHLVGLDRSQVKEYIRLRSEAAPEESEEGRVAAEHAAVQEAIRRVKENEASENPRFSIDPLPGTRPTRILIGYWKPSSEVDPKDRHAVYGVLGQNDFFLVKVVRQTRDGRFVDGNYRFGPGAMWIPDEEVEFEPHLKALNRQEIKEYCRVRQHQLDHGETSSERIENETKAVYEAQIRAGTMPYKQPHNITVPTLTASPQGDGDERLNRHHGYGGHELRRSCQTKSRPFQASIDEDERTTSRLQSVEAVERTRDLAVREIATAEAAQGRVDRRAIHRERVVAAATVAATVETNMSLERHYKTNGRIAFHKPEDMQPLNGVWARQETLSMKSGSDDVKIYDGIKYERKDTGHFMGRLISRGTIVTIDGDDYVEYRVLTKPSFFWS